jgi:hypothetical protein
MSGLMMDTTENSIHLDRWMHSREGNGDRAITRRDQEDTQVEFLPAWWAWVSRYTHRGLTNPNDRAIAILGLAQYLGRSGYHAPEPRYLAGLWKQNLAVSLLWYLGLGVEARLIIRAPTWSWLSVHGGIINDSVRLDVTTTGVVVEHVEEIQPRRPSALEDNVTSNVSPTLAEGSFIQLSGKVKRLTCLVLAQKPNYFYNSCADICVDRYPELRSNAALGALTIASEKRIGSRCYPLMLGEPPSIFWVGWYIPDSIEDCLLSETFHYLSITVEPPNQQSKEDFTQPWVIRGLALRLISDRNVFDASSGGTPAYERVSYFELEWRSTGAYLPYDAHHFRDLPNNIRRVAPKIDPHGVFKDCEARTLRIY